MITSNLGRIFIFLGLFSQYVFGATWVVAAYNSPPEAKARADVICNGTNDQIALAQSLTKGQRTKTEYDDNAYTYAYSGQSVEWLAGDYILSDTLVLPQSVDTIVHGEGTIFHYQPSSGDAVVVSGCLRCRLYFGTIWTGSSGAALAFKDRPYTNPFMPNIMNVIHFQGLQQNPPNGNNGVGLMLTKHFCVNKVEGTDIRGFGIGVLVDDSGEGIRSSSIKFHLLSGKVDTNWYWLSYVRGCGQDIVVNGQGVDSQHWFVNVDATLPGSVAIRTAALYERWMIIMGTMDRSPSTRSLILDPGAQWNWIEITPPLWNFDGYENNSGYPNNVFVQIPNNLGSKKGNATHPETQVHQILEMTESVDGPLDKRSQVIESLELCKDLHGKGLITDAEYAQKKAEILARI